MYNEERPKAYLVISFVVMTSIVWRNPLVLFLNKGILATPEQWELNFK